MIDFAVGVDGGGTHTTAAIVVGDAALATCRVRAPANPRRVGVEAAVQSVVRAVVELVSPLEGAPVPRLVAAGLAGVGDERLREEVRALLARRLAVPSYLCTDAEAALFATAADGPAAVLIAGTGSIALARDRAGVYHRAGGHAPHGGDPGSATAIGVRARSEGLVEGAADAAAADLAPLVDARARGGDASSRRVLEDAGDALVELALEATAALRDADAAGIPLGLVGGVLDHSEIVRERVLRGLAARAPGLRAGPPARIPAVGAALRARA